ncbi:hypothetical protein SE17_02600 [Kouleothrix aurantiaca]|uniref:Uncharacterized protein n=1 Tax=Kouleothrix aurantiaca TaxID=186479 RepID=A0A0P9DGI5_9CHLR|nr:hypothetical protein SE17_02600 [Kouleothrix aurantiaca]
MQTLRGTVTNLNRSTQVSGGGQNSSVITTNVAVFELDGHPVTLRDREAIILKDGDEIIVSGQRGNDGVFKAFAYRNITKNVHGGNSGMVGIVSSIILLMLPVIGCMLAGMMNAVSSGSGISMLCLFPLFIVAPIVGAILLYYSIKQRRAWQAVA